MTADYDRFQWREKETGVWVREIDECEMAYTAIQRYWRGNGRSFFHMTGHMILRVRVPDGQDRKEVEDKLDAALAKAWTTLRYHNPTIASQVVLDPSERKYLKVYHVDADGWLEKSLKRVTSGQTGMEFSNDDPPAPNLATLNVISPPQVDEGVVQRDLVLRAPHDIIDGVGTLMLFENYTRHVSRAYADGEDYQIPSLDDPQVIQNLSPPFRVAADVPPTPTEKTKKQFDEVVAREKADAERDMDIISLPYDKSKLVPGVHKRTELNLSPDETAKLTAACKSLGATPTHVFHAAMSIALRDLQEKNAEPRLVQSIAYLLRNERERCLPPFNDHRHAAAVYHSISSDKLIVDMTVPGIDSAAVDSNSEREEFLRIVDIFKHFYLKVKNNADHYQLAPLLWAKGTAEHPAPTDPAEAQGAPPAVPKPSEHPSVSISSLGKIDGGLLSPKHGDIEVHHPWVTGEELRNWLGLFLGTFRGEMSLSAAYNDAWHGKEDVDRFLRKCKDVVFAGLEL